MYFSLVYKRIEYVDLKEKNSKQMNDQIKKGKTVGEKKFTAFFKFCS